MTLTFDPADVETFAGDIATRLGAAWSIASIHIGDRLGLYHALAEGAGSAADIARRTSCNERLTDEWLRGQVAAGIVELRDDGQYTLPPARAAVLAVDDSPEFLGAAGGVLSAVFQAEDRIVHAFRTDGKLAWSDQPPCLFGAVDRFYQTGYAAALVTNWIPALERSVRRDLLPRRAARRGRPERGDPPRTDAAR